MKRARLMLWRRESVGVSRCLVLAGLVGWDQMQTSTFHTHRQHSVQRGGQRAGQRAGCLCTAVAALLQCCSAAVHCVLSSMGPWPHAGSRLIMHPQGLGSGFQ